MGKGRILARTSASVVCKGDVVAGRGMAGRSGGGAGCFWRSCSKVPSLIGAGPSSEQRMRAAALIFPSSSLAAIAAALVRSPHGPRLPLLSVEGALGEKMDVAKSGYLSWKSATRFLIRSVRLRRRPPLVGTSKIPAPKVRSRCHPFISKGARRMDSTMSVKRWPATDRAPLGICLSKPLVRFGCCVDPAATGPWAVWSSGARFGPSVVGPASTRAASAFDPESLAGPVGGTSPPCPTSPCVDRASDSGG